MKQSGAKAISVLLFAVVMIIPFQTNAFSLDDAVRSYVAYLRQQIATLQAENAQLRAKVARLEDKEEVGAVQKTLSDDTVKQARTAYARWNTIETEIDNGKYDQQTSGCTNRHGCPINPLPTELVDLIKRLFNDGTLARAGYTETYVPKYMPHKSSKVYTEIINEIQLEQTKLQEKMVQ